MGRGKPIDGRHWPDDPSARAFFEFLDKVHRDNGMKSLSGVAAGMNLRARSRVSALLRGKPPADEAQVRALIAALGGSREDIARGVPLYSRIKSPVEDAGHVTRPSPSRRGEEVVINNVGDFSYQITRLHRRGASSHHEPWREQPSQLLLAQHQVVPFAGRDDDLRRLREWRDRPDGPEAALLLLHGPGGQGKTRLALEFANETADEWHVWEASPRIVGLPGRRGGSAPASFGKRVLVVVDYAERWPVSALRALIGDFATRP